MSDLIKDKLAIRMPLPLHELAALLTTLSEHYQKQGPTYNNSYAKTPKIRATEAGDLVLYIESEYERV